MIKATEYIFRCAGLSIMIFAGLFIYIWMEVNIPALRIVNITIPEISEQVKIVHISDAHGRGISKNGRLMRAIRSFKPDVIVLTGDMVDESTTDFQPVLDTTKILASVARVLFIPGNHEWANPRGMFFMNAMASAGATVLLNDAVLINNVSMCGVDEVSFGLDNIHDALAVNRRCDILLSHSPAINEAIRGLRIPLVLSGHTHGGQIRVPLIGALFIPDKNIPPHLVRGLAMDEDTIFYVSVGLGTRIVPIRFMSRAEIALITVN